MINITITTLLVVHVTRASFSSLSTGGGGSRSISRGGGCPCRLSSNNSLSFNAINDKLCILSSDSFAILSASGTDLIRAFGRNCSGPVIRATNDCSLLCSRNNATCELSARGGGICSSGSSGRLLYTNTSRSNDIILYAASSSTGDGISMCGGSLGGGVDCSITGNCIVTTTVSTENAHITFTTMGSRGTGLGAIICAVGVNSARPETQFRCCSSPILSLHFSSDSLFIINSSFIDIIHKLGARAGVFRRNDTFATSCSCSDSSGLVCTCSRCSNSTRGGVTIIGRGNGMGAITAISSTIGSVSKSSSCVDILATSDIVACGVSSSSIGRACGTSSSCASVGRISSGIFTGQRALIRLVDRGQR